MKKLAIIGASYLQEPLITKAKNMGLETHVFAWECGDVGEKIADYFYPISIVEKEKILNICQEIKIDGICSIASDLATITVNYVANKMGLPGNSLECTKKSTNKHLMRKAFESNGIPSPKSFLVSNLEDYKKIEIFFPAIVKPTDRSGSRGICKVYNFKELENAIVASMSESFESKALIEEYVEGEEYSAECASYNGKHYLISITKKYTTGEPHFIEYAHLEPSDLKENSIKMIKDVIFQALDCLKIKNSISHSEFKIYNNQIKIIEIGARMGGDCIGSDLVQLSTGVDFVKVAICLSLGLEPDLNTSFANNAAVKYIFNKNDYNTYKRVKSQHPEIIVKELITSHSFDNVTDSSNRHGMFVITSKNRELLTSIIENSF